MMQNMVEGLVFAYEKGNPLRIPLILKTHPEWMRGTYNGIGGRIEYTDVSPAHAMEREFLEETGVHIPNYSWENFLILTGEFGVVHFFRYYTSTRFLSDIRSVTEEQVNLFEVNDLPHNLIMNLSWIIPMAMDTHISVPVLMTEGFNLKFPRDQEDRPNPMCQRISSKGDNFASCNGVLSGLCNYCCWNLEDK